jgi:hypothetical protein
MVVVQAFMNMAVVLAVPTRGSLADDQLRRILVTTLVLMGMLMNVNENVGQA